MGPRLPSLLLFVVGYTLLDTLEPLLAIGPALTVFAVASLLLTRERTTLAAR